MRDSRSSARLEGPVVVDASVVVEYLVGLSLTDRARTLIRAVLHRDVELWAPDLIFPECVSALRKLARLRAIAPAAAGEAVGHLGELPLMVAGTKDLMARAWELRATLTAYDACYVALSEELRAPLVTADRRLARGLRHARPEAIFLGDLAPEAP